MPISDSDPRVFFASERTLLAWLRTGIAIIGIGFVIARFGLFVRLLVLQSAPVHAWPAGLSAGLGIAFVLAGSFTIGVATVQHRRFIKTLSASDLPPAYSSGVAILLSMLVAMLGLLLAVYLAFTSL